MHTKRTVTFSIIGAILELFDQSSAGQTVAGSTEEAVARGLIYEVQPWLGPTQQFRGFGIAIADLNSNGSNDVVIMGRGDGQVGFFENNGSGFFTDRSLDDAESPKLVLGKGSGIAVGDYNGDGLLDIYITQQTYEPNVLLRNDGDFHFVDVAASAGVANLGVGEAALFADFDLDGWLDLYVVNYTFSSDVPNAAFRNKLYWNRGNGTFADISVAQGVDDAGSGFAAVWADINRDCRPDLYVVNDRGHLPPGFYANRLWRNDAGSMTDVSESSGAGIGMWAMGVAAGDVSGNGYPDFYVTNLPSISGYGGLNPLLINQGDETFVDYCADAGVCQYIFSWAAIFYDFDNNGWLDLYVVNQSEPNRLYAGSGAFPMTDITQPAKVSGGSGQAFNAAVGDITGNGALDLLLNNYGLAGGAPVNVQLLINHEGVNRNWIRYNIIGTEPNRFAIGAGVDTRTGDHWQWRELYAGGNNFKAQNELVMHVGLGDAALVDEIVVVWPGCEFERTLTNYPANHTWTLYPPHMFGDTDGDGVINIFDWLVMLSNWGPIQPGAELVDMNGDGAINIFDLLALLSKWGPISP